MRRSWRKEVARAIRSALLSSLLAWPALPTPGARAAVPVGPEFQVNTYTSGYQLFPSVAVAADGDFVVVWASRFSPHSIQGQRYASDGTALGSEFQVNTYTTNTRGYPSVAAASDGDFVVVWESYGSSGTDTDGPSIQGQRYASDGTALELTRFRGHLHTWGGGGSRCRRVTRRTRRSCGDV